MRRFALPLAFAALALAALPAQADETKITEPIEINATSFINHDGDVKVKGVTDKVVIVEFWATWCPPCRRSIPHLNELHKKYGDKLMIVGLTNEDKETVEKFIAKMPMEYIVGVGSKSGKDYGVRYIPTAFVFVKGKLAWNGNPLQPDFDKAIESAVGQLGSGS